MTNSVLLLGSNVGDRQQHLSMAIAAISSAIGTIVQQSSIYESEAWGNTEQDPFYNQAIEVATSLTPRQLLTAIHEIEAAQGRVRSADEKWQPRTIDIDILLYGEQSVQEKDLQIPHPELANRNFALLPLMEILPELVHPALQKPIDELYFDSKDTLEVIQLEQ